jgi:hypothetical protein
VRGLYVFGGVPLKGIVGPWSLASWPLGEQFCSATHSHRGVWNWNCQNSEPLQVWVGPDLLRGTMNANVVHPLQKPKLPT